MLKLKLDNISDELEIDTIINDPKGVLVAPKFDDKAISKISKMKRNKQFESIRLARFRGKPESEYYVVVEDQIGNIIQRARRQKVTWQVLIDKGLVEKSDVFIVKTKDKTKELSATPDPESFKKAIKRIVFDKRSALLIVKKREKIIREVEENKKDKGWVSKEIESIKTNYNHGISISRANRIIDVAFRLAGKGDVSPEDYWICKRNEKKLSKLIDLLE